MTWTKLKNRVQRAIDLARERNLDQAEAAISVVRAALSTPSEEMLDAAAFYTGSQEAAIAAIADILFASPLQEPCKQDKSARLDPK